MPKTYKQVMDDVNDTLADFPDVNPEDVVHDVLIGMVQCDDDIPADVKAELLRCELGIQPAEALAYGYLTAAEFDSQPRVW